LILDAKATSRGTGFNYRTFEPAAGALHSEGLVRDRRIAAGLRYSTNGKKYWLNTPTAGPTGDAYTRPGIKAGLASRPIHELHRRLERRVEVNEGYAPLSHDADVLHVDRSADDPDDLDGAGRGHKWWEGGREYDDLSDGESEPESLEFRGPDDEPPETDGEAEKEEETKRWKEEWDEMEGIYEEARELEYGASSSLPCLLVPTLTLFLLQATGPTPSSTPREKRSAAVYMRKKKRTSTAAFETSTSTAITTTEKATRGRGRERGRSLSSLLVRGRRIVRLTALSPSGTPDAVLPLLPRPPLPALDPLTPTLHTNTSIPTPPLPPTTLNRSVPSSSKERNTSSVPSSPSPSHGTTLPPRTLRRRTPGRRMPLT
jgi:hypothetical protein